MLGHCENEKGFSCGEANMVLTDCYDKKYLFSFTTQPDSEDLATTIDKLATQLVFLFTRSKEVTQWDIVALAVICDHSSVTVNNSAGVSGTFIGNASSPVLISALNTFKTTPYNGNQLFVTSRLVTNDLLLLNVIVNLLDNPGGNVVATLTTSGYFQILNCGKNLCIDFLTVNVASRIL